MAKEKTTTVAAETEVEATEVEVVTAPSEEKPKKRRGWGKKKEDEVEVAPEVNKPTEARATAKTVRVTPRKAQLVVDLVRGKNVSEALGILANVNKAATPHVVKVIKSAAANAINNYGMDEESLYISEIYANEGMRMKRYRPRAKGSAAGIIKRTSHITVVVKERE